MSFNYSVAIKLSVANLASSGVKMLAADLIKAHGAATNLQTKLSALKMAAVGLTLSKAGDGILGFLHKSVDASKELVTQLSLMNAAHMTQREIAEATAAAYRTSGEVMTTSVAENLKAIRELRSVFGKGEGMHEAYAVLPLVQRTKAIMEALTGKEQEGVAFDMVKAIELGTKGRVTTDILNRQAEMMTRSLMAFGGTLNVSDFHSALKYSRAAAPYMSDDFKFNYLPTLIQEMKTGRGGASGAGVAIASLFALVQGKQIPKELISNWVDAGLIRANGVVADKHNRTTSKVLPGAMIGAELAASNPYLYAQQYIKPAIQKLMATKHIGEIEAYYSLTKDRVKAFALQTLVNKAPQFERDKALIASGLSTKETYDKLVKSNPLLAEMALHKQYQNILATIGYQVLPQLLPYLVKFAGALSSINQWMHNNPGTAKTLVVALAGLGIALSVIGKVMMSAALIKFLGLGPMLARGLSLLATPFGFLLRLVPIVARGFTSLLVGMGPIGWTLLAIGAAALLVWNNWKEIWGNLKLMFGDMVTGFKQLFSGDILGALGSFAAVFLRGWQTIFNTLIAGLNTILPQAWQISKMHFADDFDAWRKGSAAVPSKSGQTVQVHSTVNIDGRKVAESVSSHQARAASRPAASSGRFDPARAQPFVAMGAMR